VQESCKVKPHWNVVNGAVKGALAGISLAQLSSAPAEAVAQHPADQARAPALAGEQV
jgi:hypothetical protein